MKIEAYILDGNLIIDLIRVDGHTFLESVTSQAVVPIEDMFEEMSRIEEDRRVEHARAASRAGEIRAGKR
jgi:hypothetical protein